MPTVSRHRTPLRRFSHPLIPAIVAILALLWMLPSSQASAQGPKVTYQWHMHQPIYWNDQQASGPDRYEYAWESLVAKRGGRLRPENDLDEIFGKEDRVAAYQWRMRDSLAAISGHPNSGASVSYSGALMENVASLGANNQFGYTPSWKAPLQQANGWLTTNGKRRLDIVNFTFHHSLTGLHNPETLFMEIKLQQEKMKAEFGAGSVSKGFFPTELTFSTRLIPTLKQLGIDWTFVSGEHVARACPDFPLQLGSGGVNCAPPNKADQQNPNGVDFIRMSISRGCAPVNANPLSYQPAYAKYVDPATGTESKMVVVPVDQAQSWLDGYGCLGASFVEALKVRNNPARPSLVVLSHDGDNAFGGGYSYYNECVPNLANDASNRGAEVTQVDQYLAQYPVPTSSLIHVEDGGWVNADGDFGSPTFINWNFPLLNAAGQHDPANGWHEKAREMAVFTAMLNRVLTAQQIVGSTPNFAKILNPDGATSAVDRAWHYFLGSLDSGNVYYGTVLDLEMKGTLGCNEAAEHVNPILAANPTADTTPPSIWVPQRFPYNPGSLNYGVEFQYKQVVDDGDFHIWTFISDVSGPANAVLKYRIDNDGTNPLATNQNETFAGGSEVGAWQRLPMARRAFPAGNVYNKPELNYFELPLHIADHHSVEVVGLRSKLIDYYVEATDARGNVAKSPIQHVYIGDGQGATNPTTTVVTAPAPPARGQQATITYDATGRNLQGAATVKIHLGKNGWAGVITPNPSMTSLGSNKWSYTYTVPTDATVIDIVFNNGAGIWDNNGGADWHIATTGSALPPVAGFTAMPQTGTAPLAVTFTNTTTGGTSYAWDFDNNGTTDSTAANPVYNYTAAGTYTVKLTATNAAGSNTSTRTSYITVSALQPPVADFTATPLSGVAPLTVNFANESTGGAATGFAWDFDNNGTTDSTVANPTFTYTTAGTRTVKLTVTNAAGSNTVTRASYISVTALQPPVAEFTAVPLTGNAPLTVNFANATTGGGTISYAWDFDNNGTTDSTVANPSFTYTTAGVRTVKLTASNAAGSNAKTRASYITVNTPPPVLNVDKTSVSSTVATGGTAAAQTFAIRNTGGGSLSYTLVKVDAGSGTSWFTVTPASGTSTGESDSISVSFASSALTAGTRTARIRVDSNGATVAPFVDVTLTITTAVPSVTSIAPSPAVANQTARLWYKPAGALASATAVRAHWGVNGWQGVIQTPMTRHTASGMWYLDVTVPDYATVLDAAFTNGTGAWDNNSGADWHFAVTGGVAVPATTTIAPNPPVAGQAARLWYKSAGGPLASATSVRAHWGTNGWVGTTQVAMVRHASGMWYLDVTVPAAATVVDMVFTNGSGTWDNNGGADWHFATSRAPLASFSAGPLAGIAPLAVSFNNTTTGGATAYAWDFDNNGTTDSTVASPSFTYTAAGTYTVKLTASNAIGSHTATQSNYITVSALQAPVADFTASPLAGTAPLNVVFTNASTGGAASSWAWDFDNNGTTDSTVANPTRTYSTPGTYTVKLTATNAAGSNTRTRTGYIVVTALQAPVADFTAVPLSGMAPLAVSFTNATTGGATSYAWDFDNNGTTDSTVANPSFSYTVAGTYAVKLTATNAAGSNSKTRASYITVSGGGAECPSTTAGMGATLTATGTTFRVWAPNATTVFVAGAFNGWSATANRLCAEGTTGYYSGNVPGALVGDQYKYVITTGGVANWRHDPYAKDTTGSSNTTANSIIYGDTFDWQGTSFSAPWNETVIYQLHVGRFNDLNTSDANPGTFQNVVARLPYLRDLGVNMIELLPVYEFEGAFQWGYGQSHMFAPESSYGSPVDLKTLVREAHKVGVGVMFDVIYNHMGTGDNTLWRYDGWTPPDATKGGVYFYGDHRSATAFGERFDYGRIEVRNFLQDSNLHWLREYRADGLRFDATAYIRQKAWDDAFQLPDGKLLLKNMNNAVDNDPTLANKLIIAEDLQEDANLIRATSTTEGLGFDSQWVDNYRGALLFGVLAKGNDSERDMNSVFYALDQNFDGRDIARTIYLESHDDVNTDQGKNRVAKAIDSANPGGWRAKKLSTLGAAVLMTSRGIPMIFQGQEILEDQGFPHDVHGVPVDWAGHETQFAGIKTMFRDLILARRNRTAAGAIGTTKGLTGSGLNVHHINHTDKLVAYHRWHTHGVGDDVVVVANFSGTTRTNYQVGMPYSGTWTVRINTDRNTYSSDFSNTGSTSATANGAARDGMAQSASVTVAPYSALILSR